MNNISNGELLSLGVIAFAIITLLMGRSSLKKLDKDD